MLVEINIYLGASHPGAVMSELFTHITTQMNLIYTGLHTKILISFSPYCAKLRSNCECSLFDPHWVCHSSLM